MRKKPLPASRRAARAAHLTVAIEDDRTLRIQTPVLVTQRIYRQVEGTGKSGAIEVCRRTDINQLTPVRKQLICAFVS